MTTALTTAFGGIINPDVAQKVFINIAGRDAPITAALLSLGRKRQCSGPKLLYKGGDLAVRRTQIDNVAGYDENDTEFIVDDGSIFAAEDIAIIESTGEIILVTAVDTDTLTVVRGIGTTGGAAILDDAFLTNIGPARGEASTGLSMRTNTTDEYTSYTQIFERKIRLSETLAKSQLATEDERTRLRREQMLEIARDMELAALYGEPGEVTGAGAVRRTTQGIYSFALANVDDANGTLTELELDDWLTTVFDRGSNYRLIFGDGPTCNIIRRLKKPIEQSTVDAKKVGFTATRFATPDGEFDLIRNPHMHGPLAQAALAIDPEEVNICHIAGRDLRLIEDVQDKDADAVEDKYLAEIGFTWGNPNTHGLLTNVQLAG